MVQIHAISCNILLQPKPLGIFDCNLQPVPDFPTTTIFRKQQNVETCMGGWQAITVWSAALHDKLQRPEPTNWCTVASCIPHCEMHTSWTVLTWECFPMLELGKHRYSGHKNTLGIRIKSSYHHSENTTLVRWCMLWICTMTRQHSDVQMMLCGSLWRFYISQYSCPLLVSEHTLRNFQHKNYRAVRLWTQLPVVKNKNRFFWERSMDWSTSQNFTIVGCSAENPPSYLAFFCNASKSRCGRPHTSSSNSSYRKRLNAGPPHTYSKKPKLLLWKQSIVFTIQQMYFQRHNKQSAYCKWIMPLREYISSGTAKYTPVGNPTQMHWTDAECSPLESNAHTTRQTAPC